MTCNGSRVLQQATGHAFQHALGEQNFDGGGGEIGTVLALRTLR